MTVLKQAYAVIKQIENHAEHEKYSENEQSRVAAPAQEQAVENANQMLTQTKSTVTQRAAECVQATAALQAASDACREAVDDEDRDKTDLAERTLIRMT